ncbi:cation transport protein ChaC [Hasllibacter halocynthiae]|uniref:glutathione-specific gamma-glutamylcyclotransferase n=1 Tax=Hasllibacter halocynthiae TaxID=595589 RepID=A0A2T0X107_9RHOB|nr:gamma-glutamylcyclotransferase [Hasllibacter halocynthiae]PRY92620.1 cation transport protein ChaC [Hasllibacter halocynthiae]
MTADAPDGPLWVFAYGSLIWSAPFEPVETRRAVLHDFRRSFCMYSVIYRGTEQDPGLVLALDHEEGVRCRGLALRVRDEERDAVLAEVRRRELVSSAYLEKRVALETEAGQVEATAFVIDRTHAQYAGGLPLDVQAERIGRCAGDRGPNAAYLFETVDALRRWGIRDGELEQLARRVRADPVPFRGAGE